MDIQQAQRESNALRSKAKCTVWMFRGLGLILYVLHRPGLFSKVSSEHEIICGRLDEGRTHWTHGHNANVHFYMIGWQVLLAFANFMHRSSGRCCRKMFFGV